MIKFGEINIENFASIQKLRFNFDNPGVVHVIRGRTGSGKTSLISALYYVTYGEPLKKKAGVEPWKHLRTKDSYMGTKVEMYYHKNQDKLQVIRCKNYKGNFNGIKGDDNLFIIVNGKEKTDFTNKAAKQKFIEEFLGITPNLFKNGIVFGQKMNRFIEETGPKQKEIFDEFCSTTFINLIRENAKEDLNTSESDLNILNLAFTNLEKKKEENYDTYKTLKRVEDNFDTEKEAKLKELKVEKQRLIDEDKDFEKKKTKRINKLRSQIKALPIKDLKELENQKKLWSKKLIDITRAVMEHVFTVNELEANRNKVLNQIKNSLSGKCIYCNNETTNQKTLLKQRAELNQELKGYENQLPVFKKLYEKKSNDRKNLETKLEMLEKEFDAQRDFTYQIREWEAAIEFTKSQGDKNKSLIERLGKDIIKLKNKTQEINSPKYFKLYRQAKTKLKELSLQRESLLNNNNLLNWLIKDPLSNNGLKAFIFKDLIQEVNLRLATYSSILGLRVKFGIKDSKRKDFFISITKNGNTVPYEDLSGGQQQLITVSIVFAMHDIVTKNLKCNLLIMDEIFEHLDSENVEKVAELVQKKIKPYTALYLITHLSEYTPNNSHTIQVSLVKEHSVYKL